MPYLCMRKAQVTVADRDLPIALLDLLLDLARVEIMCRLSGE